MPVSPNMDRFNSLLASPIGKDKTLDEIDLEKIQKKFTLIPQVQDMPKMKENSSPKVIVYPVHDDSEDNCPIHGVAHADA